MDNMVMHVIPNVTMSYGHKGLFVVAKKNKVDVTGLKPGQFVLFINKPFTACKLYAANNVVAHYKHPRGKLNYAALTLIPKFFDGRGISYDKALEQVLKKHYGHLFEKPREKRKREK